MTRQPDAGVAAATVEGAHERLRPASRGGAAARAIEASLPVDPGLSLLVPLRSHSRRIPPPRQDAQTRLLARQGRPSKELQVHEENPSGVRLAGVHAYCLLCGTENPKSLKLEFASVGAGAVATRFRPNPELQGYDSILHGGVVSALLDAAMTHCLFSHGIQAVTGDLHVRFLHSVPCDTAMEIRGRILASYPPLFRVRAEISAEGRLLAWEEGKFVRRKAGP